MKNLRNFLGLTLAIALPHLGHAALTGPYTVDPSTLVLLHFDQTAGVSATPNAGSLGGTFYSVNYSSDALPLPVVTTMLGGTGYSTNSPAAISFNKCDYNTTGGYLIGFDYNADGQFEGDNGSGSSADFLPMSKLNIGNGSQTPFTLEALIQPASLANNQEIICTDSQASSRGFQFRVTSGSLQFQFITGGQAISSPIPTTGPNAFVANAWYHVALVYNGTTATLYWTRMSPAMGAASVLASANLTLGASDGTVTGPLVIGNRGRPNGVETFGGGIDEVRISSVARAANQMQFYSPQVTITQNPASQNVDYNQPVNFNVGASSLSTLGYQWLFNSNAIAGATNASYVIPHVASGNGGYYSVVITNSTGNSATSSPALLVVGAANFLDHRYSFTSDASDSVGNANGILFGDAMVTGGSLILDGTAGTFMQLPAYLFTGATATALTVEFWATYGENPDNVYVFSFGNTNNQTDGLYGGLEYFQFTPHNASGHQIITSSGDNSFNQTVTGNGVLDGETVHVSCVMDPPNGNLAIYTNGVLEAINTNLSVNISGINDAVSWIGASLYQVDPYCAVSIDEFRIYNGALSAISIEQSDNLGPNIVLANGPATFVRQPVSTSVPVGESATFSAAATGYLPIFYQWFKNGTAISGATNAIYTYFPTAADNGAQFSVNATNTIGVTTYVAKSVAVTLGVYVPPVLSWLGTAAGGANNTWDTTSPDWTNDLLGGGIVAFTQTNAALFDDRSGGGDVDVEQPVIPYKMTVNTVDGYMFTSYSQLGSLAGGGSLTKLGSGLLDIDLTNNLTGPVTVSAGELQIGNNDSAGTLGSGPVTNNATISFYRTDTALTVGNPIHGAGTLSFDGSGSVTVGGVSDYTGGTLLNQGIVDLLSGLGFGHTSGVGVANGAQLYITANVNPPQPLTLNGAGDSNGALRKGGGGTSIYTGPVMMNSDSYIGVDGGATLVMSNTISGVAQLYIIGNGTLALAAPNSYFNGTTLDGPYITGTSQNGPVVEINANGALGTGPVTINNSGRFVLGTGVTFTNFVAASVINPGSGLGLFMVNDNTNGAVTTISGPLEFDATSSSGGNFVGPTTSGYLDVTGPITNNVTGEIVVRSGLMRFAGGGSYTLFDLSGTTSLGANNGLSTNATVNVGVAVDGIVAILDLNGFNQTLTGLADGGNGAELVTNSAKTPSTLTLNLSSAVTYSGPIGGNISLVVEGSASEDLAGSNSYTGNTTILGGSLELAEPTLAATSTVTITNGALLQLDFAVTNKVSALVLNGISQPLGVYNSATSPNYFAGPGSLQVASAIASSPTNITYSVNGTTLSLSWPTAYRGWLVQSNSVNLGVAADWLDMSNTAAGTSFNVTINPRQKQVFYRLRHP